MQVRLAASAGKRAFVMFLMLTGRMRPGYDYLVRRKLPTFWRDLPPGPTAEDLGRFLTAAGELGFTGRTRSGVGSHVIGRLLIQTGRRLDALLDSDFDDLLAASAARHSAELPSRHYSSAAHRPAGAVPPRHPYQAAGQRDRPAAAKLRAAHARRYRPAAADVRRLLGPADRHPHPRHRHRHRQPAQPLRRPPGHGRPAPGQPRPARSPPTHRDLSHRDHRSDQLPHRDTDLDLRTARPSTGDLLPAQQHHRMELGRST